MYSMDVATKKICLASEQLPKSFLYFPLDDLRDVITKKTVFQVNFGRGGEDLWTVFRLNFYAPSPHLSFKQTFPFFELCCVLDDTVATNNPNETPQSTMTPLPASLMEIVIVTRSKIGVHPLQRSEVFRLTRIQAGQNFVVKLSLMFCKNCNVVLCNMFQRIAPGRTRQGSWLSGALFLNNALPTSHNKWCTVNYTKNIKEHYSAAIPKSGALAFNPLQNWHIAIRSWVVQGSLGQVGCRGAHLTLQLAT